MCKPPLIRFAFVRSILFRTFSAIFIPDTRCGGTLQAIDSVSIALLAPTGKYHYPHTFHRLFGKLFRILKRHIYRSSFRSLGVWFLWLPRFHTSRVINVLAELIFYCQVTWSFYSPYTCIGVEVWYLTTVFYCDLKSLLSLHKILRFFL